MPGELVAIPHRISEDDALAVWQSRRLTVRHLLGLLIQAEADNFGEFDDHAHWGDVGTIELLAQRLAQACALVCHAEIDALAAASWDMAMFDDLDRQLGPTTRAPGSEGGGSGG